MTTAQYSGKVISLTHRPLLSPGNIPGTNFCYRLSRPQGHTAIGRILCQCKISMTPAGIKPATFRFVAQYNLGMDRTEMLKYTLSEWKWRVWTLSSGLGQVRVVGCINRREFPGQVTFSFSGRTLLYGSLSLHRAFRRDI